MSSTLVVIVVNGYNYMIGSRTLLRAMLGAVVLTVLLACAGTEAGATTIHVPDNHATIQWAVNNATAGDIIIVRDGTYTENVDVDASHLTIRSENGSANCVVEAESVSGDYHIFNVSVDYVNISGFTVIDTEYSYSEAGIYLDHVEYCDISNNNMSNNWWYGIYLRNSSNNTITNNTANSNSDWYWYGDNGIYLSGSNNNTLANNNASDNYYGIILMDSSGNTLTENTVSGNTYNFHVSGNSLPHYTHTIDTTNKVDGKPVYYWVDEQDKEVPGDAGYVGIVNSANITVRDLILTNNGVGVLFVYTENSKIENVNASNNINNGIYLWHSSNNILTNNTANSNKNWGWGGIELYHSSDNTLTNNTASNNDDHGICLFCSSDNTLTNNNVSNNNERGIYLLHSSNNTLLSNTMSGNTYNLCVGGDYPTHTIDTTNRVDGKPVYYWVDEQDKEVPGDAGYVGIVNSANITVRDLTLTNNGQGVLFAYTENSRIENVTVSNNGGGIYIYSSKNNILTDNNASNNYYGIHLWSSSNNIITNNNASNNNDGIELSHSCNNIITNNNASNNNDGIGLSYSCNNNITNNNVSNNDWSGIDLSFSSNSNNIYFNNLVENEHEQAYDTGTNNQWNDINKGNYWSDYTTRYPSATHDSVVWDTPYVINGDAGAADNYPLVNPVGVRFFIYQISPDCSPNNTTTNVRIYGIGFTEGVNVSLVKGGEEDIEGEDTEVLEYQISTTFNLTGRTAGLWDVVVRLPSGEESRLKEAFEVGSFLRGIFPDYGFNLTKEQLVTVYGSGFTDGVSVKLTKGCEEDIEGENTEVLSKTRFATKFNLAGRATGLWDVVATLPSGEQDCLNETFEIKEAAGEGYLLQNITIEASESQGYGIVVPETHNLFITLQKTTLVNYGASWWGKLSLLKDGKEIASDNGFHDIILQIVDPEPGFYTIEVTASQTGSGIITAVTSLPELPLGEWVVGTIYTSYGSVWYQVEVPPDQDTLHFDGEGMGWGSHFDIYYGEYGGSNHWMSACGPRTSIEIPNPASGTYIVEFLDSAMVGSWGHWSEDQTRDVLIKADTRVSVEPPPDYLPTISSISPDSGGNTGFVTIEITGGWLDSNATVSLTRIGYENLNAQHISGEFSGTTLSATFNLIGTEPGEWDLVVTNADGRNATAPGPFTIEEGGESELCVEIVGREKIRVGRPARYVLHYENSGNMDMPAPLFLISASAPSPVYLRLPGQSLKAETLSVLDMGSAGSPGVLHPGSSHSITFQMKKTATDTSNLQVSAITVDPIFEDRNIANFLDAFSPAPGIPIEFNRVFSQSYSSYLGPLGYGWIHNYDIHLEEFSDGNVALLRGDNYNRFFLSNNDGTYTALRGYTTLTCDHGDTFQLKEKDGTIYGFRTDLRLDYIEDTNGNRVDMVYNSDDQLIGLQHSCGESFELEYNDDGRISRLIDHAGRVTEYHYDESGELLLGITTPDGLVTNYTYTSDGLKHGLSSISYPEGIQQFFEYDGDGRLSEKYLDGEEELIQYLYDVATETTYIMDANGGVTTIRADEFGQINRLENPLGSVNQYEYDKNSNLVRTTDPLDNAYDFSYDEMGNIVKTTNPLDHEISMDYDPSFNKLTRIQDARGNGIIFDYDEYGNLLSTTYPDSSTESMSYDAAGNPVSGTTRNGDVISYTYNDKGQLTRKDYPDGSWVALEYDDAGNMISATDESGTIGMEYNVMNLLTKVTYPTGRFFEYNYDDAGRLVKREDQDGNALNYEYDAASRMVRMSDESDSDIVRYEYDAVGRLSKKSLGSGAYTTYEYDAAGQIRNLINYNASGGVLSGFDYTYDLAGNPISINTLEGTYSYKYDSIRQLTKVTYPDGHSVSYSYDAAGNRISVIDDGVTAAYTTNNMNQYTDVEDASYFYDANGNLISKTEDGQTTTYQYNFDNRLTTVTSPEGTWEYDYDALGSRVGMVHNSTEHRYLVDPMGLGDVVAEYDGDGSLIARYTHGLGLISQIDSSGNPYYYHFNPTGHTMEITNEDGDVVNSYKYSPFGMSLEKEETISNPFGYVGEFGVMDDGNDLNYMRMRYYQPEIGRFLQVDPSGIAFDHNLYRYVHNSPIKFSDPLGLFNHQVFQQFLKDLSLDSSVAATGCFLIGAPPGVIVFGGIAALSKGLEISLYSKHPIADTVRECFSMALPIRKPFNLLLDPILDLVGEGFYSFFSKIYGHDQLIMEIESVSSTTPEDKYGPTGFDHPDTPPEARKRFIPPDQNFYYKIDFWNKENATAPACDVFVTDQLDTNLNNSTFRFNEIGFLNWTVKLEPCQYFNLYVDTRPEMNLIVNAEGTFNPETGVINWTFRSLDPDTLEIPEDPMAGFLPPITESGYEIGWVCFSADPEPDLPTGTQIPNQAFVEFDFAGDINDHPAPKEGPWINTIDADSPESYVKPLPENQASVSFTVEWEGEDYENGSGIRDYTIYVSEDGLQEMTWLVHTNNTSAVFAGKSGHSYAFYSIARDGVGHVEEVPEDPDATTFIDLPANEVPIALFNYTPMAPVIGEAITFNASESYDPDGQIVSYAWDFGDGNTTTATEEMISHPYASEGDYRVNLTVTDDDGATNQTSKVITVSLDTIQLVITLNTGWNLISAPLNLTTWALGEEAVAGDPLNVTPENSLTSIYRYNTSTESFEKCSHYDDWGWEHATGSESFTELEPGRGYWVVAKNDCSLTFTGTAPSDLTISLDAGWNCVGWYSTSRARLGEEAAVGDPLNPTPENSLTSIYRYNSSTESFEKCSHYDDWGWEHATGSESFTELEPGRGYWVMAKNDCDWKHET